MSRRLFSFLLSPLLVLLLVSPQAFASWTIDGQGQLFQSSSGQVLSKDSGDSGEDRSNRETETKTKEQTETKTENHETSSAPSQKAESELQLPDGTRVINAIKNGETRTEVRQGNVKIKLEQKNGETKMKMKNETTGEEQELEVKKNDETETEDDLLTIKERENENNVNVGTENGKFVIKRKGVGAATAFPLSVNLKTNALTATTPAGEKTVTILPDQAVQNMLSQNILTQTTTSGLSTSSSAVAQLVQSPSGELQYEVQGEHQEKAFGFIPVTIKKTAVVSSQTGALVDTRETFQNRLLDLISF